MTCERSGLNFARSSRPKKSRLLCNLCDKFITRTHMSKHMTSQHAVKAGTWLRQEHPEVLSEVSSTATHDNDYLEIEFELRQKPKPNEVEIKFLGT